MTSNRFNQTDISKH